MPKAVEVLGNYWSVCYYARFGISRNVRFAIAQI